jgi:FKBP-type peptidyl-prolyl cis-trans isomerase (trigger factor)
VTATVTEIAPCQQQLRIRLSPEAASPIRAAVLAEFQKAASVPGFRKGKAPEELVKRQYAPQIHHELLQRLTEHACARVLEEHRLKPAGPIEVTQRQWSETEGLSVDATLEVEPTFELGAYKGMALPQSSCEVSPEECQQALRSLQDSMAQLVPTQEGTAPVAAGVQEPGAPPAGLQKERRVPPLDDELAKDLGFQDVPQLTAHVEATLRERKRDAARQHVDAAVGDALLTRHPFEVPPRLVAQQQERLIRDVKVRLLLSGTPEDALEAEAAKVAATVRASAERRVKLAFVLDRIAEQERIGVTEHELVERLWQIAKQWKKDPVQVRKVFDERGLWPSVASAVRQEKTMAFLRAAGTVTNGSSYPTSSTQQSAHSKQ